MKNFRDPEPTFAASIQAAWPKIDEKLAERARGISMTDEAVASLDKQERERISERPRRQGFFVRKP